MPLITQADCRARFLQEYEARIKKVLGLSQEKTAAIMTYAELKRWGELRKQREKTAAGFVLPTIPQSVLLEYAKRYKEKTASYEDMLKAVKSSREHTGAAVQKYLDFIRESKRTAAVARKSRSVPALTRLMNSAKLHA